MSDRPTNRRLIAISRPTSYLDDQAKTKRCPADQHSSPPPVLGSIRPIRVNYIEATSVHHAGTNLRSTARVEPPLPPASRRRPTACVTPPWSRGRQLASRRRLTACVTSPGRRPSAWRRLKMSSSSDGKFSCSAPLLLCSWLVARAMLLAHCSCSAWLIALQISMHSGKGRCNAWFFLNFELLAHLL